MKMNRKIIATLALGALLGVKAANAQSSEVDVNALLQRIQELEQKVKVIERKGELDTRPSLRGEVVADGLHRGDRVAGVFGGH